MLDEQEDNLFGNCLNFPNILTLVKHNFQTDSAATERQSNSAVQFDCLSVGTHN